MKKSQIKKNIAAIMIMNNQIMALGNEYADVIWFMVYPDEADYEEICEMAKDEEMMDLLYTCYDRIVTRFAKNMPFVMKGFEIRLACC